MKKFILYFLLLSLTFQFNYLTYKKTDDIKKLLNYNPVELGDEYKEDLELIDKVKEDEKKTICMILVRNNIFYVNEDLKQIMKSTKFKKEDVFDRAILDMYNICILKITQTIVNDFFLSNNPKVLDSVDVGIDFSFNSDKLINSKPIFAPYEKDLIKMLYGEEKEVYEEDKEDIKEERKEDIKQQVKNEETKEETKEDIKEKKKDLKEDVNESLNISKGKMTYIFYGFFFGIFFALILIFLSEFFKKKNQLTSSKEEDNIKGKKIKTK